MDFVQSVMKELLLRLEAGKRAQARCSAQEAGKRRHTVKRLMGAALTKTDAVLAKKTIRMSGHHWPSPALWELFRKEEREASRAS